MARYAYAPLSVDESQSSSNNRRRSASTSRNEGKVNERMPTFVGLCILIAITFVLSRSGGNTIGAGNNVGGTGSVNSPVNVDVPSVPAAVGGEVSWLPASVGLSVWIVSSLAAGGLLRTKKTKVHK
jgi:hypothetical protein